MTYVWLPLAGAKCQTMLVLPAVVAIDEQRPGLFAVSLLAPLGEQRLRDSAMAIRDPGGQVEDHLVVAGVVTEDADGVAIQAGQLVAADWPFGLPAFDLCPEPSGIGQVLAVRESLELDRRPVPQSVQIDHILNCQISGAWLRTDRSHQGEDHGVLLLLEPGRGQGGGETLGPCPLVNPNLEVRTVVELGCRLERFGDLICVVDCQNEPPERAPFRVAEEAELLGDGE